MLHYPRILIVRLSSIGDVLHATPVATALKRAFPCCHITWIVSRTPSSLLLDNPNIDRVFIWSREDFEAAAANRQIGQLRKLWHRLKKFYHEEQFDLALDIHGLFLSGAITAASKAPRRIGMANTRELNRYFMTELAPPPNDPHVIRRYLSILAPLGIHQADEAMTLVIPAHLQDFAKPFLTALGVNLKKKILLINMKTSWPSKNWNNENFAKLITLLPPNVEPILCGSPHDLDAAAEVKHLCARPLFDVTGKTTLLELAALLKQADLLLSGDTGTLHMATAVGTRTIGLWGPTKPEVYGPLGPGHVAIRSNHPCIACHKTKCRLPENVCLQSIRPERINRQIGALLSSDC